MTNVFENSQGMDVEELKEKSAKSDLAEDLTVISGIGPSTALKLNKANINTIKQLADITPSELSVIS
ncbi:MAG: helix-hairpin-helix domain-containing protein, partial [Candidatus Hermodarchaeota archaeon]